MFLKSDTQKATVRLPLPQVTLFSATSIALPQTVQALRASSASIDFAAIKLFSHIDLPDQAVDGIDLVCIPELRSRDDYSRFILKDLADQIETPFALCVQWDGYVIRPECWRAEFQDYDYIGAVWPQYTDGWAVGNGGFSLRSAALMRATQDKRVALDAAEDLVIGRHARLFLEQEHSIRIAPPSLAEHFSFERGIEDGTEFGFHGVFNMHSVIGSKNFCALVATLSPGLINTRDLRLLARRAAACGDFRFLKCLMVYYWRTLCHRII